MPIGWILCNGSTLSRTEYADLFAVIGTSFGSGDGTTTFAVPDFRDRFPEGVGTNSLGVSISAGIPDFYGFAKFRWMSYNAAYSEGIISYEYTGEEESLSQTSTERQYIDTTFRGSRYDSLYKDGSTVQPSAVASYYLIKS